jgi:N-acyl-D-amino-acid deacylase
VRLEEAVRKMTSLAASNVGLKDRGTIRAGSHADLVLFDAAAVIDRSTIEAPHAQATGVHTVWVNGQVVFQKNATTEGRPGRVLRRTDTAR